MLPYGGQDEVEIVNQFRSLITAQNPVTDIYMTHPVVLIILPNKYVCRNHVIFGTEKNPCWFV
jgi:hypothetical protein